MNRGEKFTDKPFGYYVDKIHRRIFRRVLEYKVLDSRLATELDLRKKSIIDTLGLSEQVVDSIEIKDHLEKACLTGLKAEFELFLTIYCTLVVDHLLDMVEQTGHIPDAHKGIVDVVQDKNRFFRGFMQSGLRDARRLFIEQAVPSHGLDRLVGVLNKCGWTVFERLEQAERSGFSVDLGEPIENPWTQIKMSFQVRHAIEHSFSKVGKPFLFKTKALWRDTTWSRHFDPQSGPELGQRVLIDGVDICRTASSMTWVASMLREHWQEALGNSSA